MHNLLTVKETSKYLRIPLPTVYYLVQRYSLMNGDKHPPEWQSKMTRNAVIFAVLSAVLFWGVSTAFTRPASQIKGRHELEPGRAMP